MPKGFAGAQKAGQRNNSVFRQKPRGVTYFRLAANQEAVVRFLQESEDIEWLRQWKMAPNSLFPFGEKIPCVDQFEDGTPDPGYAANLKSTFTAYPIMVWRNAPVYQRTPDGQLVKDPNGNKVITGYADQVAVWECSFAIYETLKQTAADYGGLMSRDFKVKRTGSQAKDTRYHFAPAVIDGGPMPMTQNDMQLAATQRPNLGDYLRVPTYDELYNYIYGVTPDQANPPAPTFTQQITDNNTSAMGGGPNPFLS